MSDKAVKSEYISARVTPSVAASIEVLAQQRGMKVGAIAREILTNYTQAAKSP